MKRLLGLALVLALLPGLTARAEFYEYFPDVPDDTEYAYAVNALAEMGIITGDGNGNFNPDNTMTRADFATIVIRLIGEEERAMEITESSFSDVPSNHWACGYIMTAAELGLITGDGKGRFMPNDTLLYEHAVTLLIKVLGYEDEAQAAGGWPNGYLTVGNEIELTANTSAIKGQPTKRGTVAILIYNAIKPIFYQ